MVKIKTKMQNVKKRSKVCYIFGVVGFLILVVTLTNFVVVQMGTGNANYGILVFGILMALLSFAGYGILRKKQSLN